MMLISILNLIIAVILIVFLFLEKNLEYRNILMALFGLNLILIIINFLI